MRAKLKPVGEQVMVITGATSGIGLSTARLAAQRGASLMLAARNERALRTLAEELGARGAAVAWHVTDVGLESDVRALAAAAVARFGGFDTWINNAGVSTFGPVTDTPVEDQRRLFDTNYWGVVYGSLAAVAHFADKPGGGKLINLGSILSDMTAPLQTTYSASKHAIRGFTNGLRMEMQEQKLPVSITLVKPAAIDTPYKDHARNYMGEPLKNPPPVYATPLVAQAVLYAADHHVRSLTVGGGGWLQSLAYRAAPALAEPVVARIMPALYHDRKAALPRSDNLYGPGSGGRERAYYAVVRESSVATAAQMRPRVTAGFAVAGLLLAAGAYQAGRLLTHRGRRQPERTASWRWGA